jgi:hypothetical protein
LAAPSLIFYSQGYRFDFETKRIVQTGGLYLKAAPRGAQVYINGILKDETSVFGSSSLIKNLIPKTYSIEVRKQGYHSWQKNLPVLEKQVTEAKNIILFPEEVNFQKLNATTTPSILASATSSDQNKVLEFTNYEIWVSFLRGRENQSPSNSKEKVFLTRLSEKICQVLWLNDYYLVFTAGDGCSKIKVAEIDDRDKLNVIDLAQFPAPQIFFDRKVNKLYVWSEETLYSAENLLP